MKKIIAILLLLLLCVQAVPVVQFFVDEDVTYSWVDEDKPEDGKIKGKKECKLVIQIEEPFDAPAPVALHFPVTRPLALPCPHLEFFTPPPNGIA